MTAFNCGCDTVLGIMCSICAQVPDPGDSYACYNECDCIPLTGKPYVPTYPINIKPEHVGLLIPDERIVVSTDSVGVEITTVENSDGLHLYLHS